MVVTVDDISRQIAKARLDSALLANLEEVYREIDQQINALNLNCEQCGKCCHFARFDHNLMTTTAEAAYFMLYLMPQTEQIPLPPTKKTNDTLPVCPFLKDRTCTARQGRMLGCRIFFCQAQGQKKRQMEDLYEIYHQRIKELHAEHHIRYDYLPWGKALQAIRRLVCEPKEKRTDPAQNPYNG